MFRSNDYGGKLTLRSTPLWPGTSSKLDNVLGQPRGLKCSLSYAQTFPRLVREVRCQAVIISKPSHDRADPISTVVESLCGFRVIDIKQHAENSV